MKEGDFNARVVRALKSKGIWAYKTADKFKAGVPDIYVASGHWIESKIVRVKMTQNRAIDLPRFITPEQHHFAKELITAGDKVDCWYYFPFQNLVKIMRYRDVVPMYPNEITGFNMKGIISQPANWGSLIEYWEELYGEGNHSY